MGIAMSLRLLCVLATVLITVARPGQAQVATSFQVPTDNYPTISPGCNQKTAITLDFGCPNKNYGNKLHVAQDIIASTHNMEVRATAPGKVMLARPYKKCPNWGHIIVIEHTLLDGSRVSSIYGHLDPATVVISEGSTVDSGGKIIGKTGNYMCWKEHLHFGIYLGAYGAQVGNYPSWLAGYMDPATFPGKFDNPLRFIQDHTAPNQPPTAGFSMTSFGQNSFSGRQLDAVVRTGSTTTVQFDGSLPFSFDSDPGGTVTSWQWRVNGVAGVTTPTFSRSFGVGLHTIELTVTDNNGQMSASAVGTIQVKEAPPAEYARPMSSERGGHCAVLLANKQVLVAGGLTPAGRTTTAELYDWQTDTWSPTTTPMVSARDGHVATLLTSGKVLISGGYDTSGQTLKSAEIYDPDSKSFTRVGDMAAERVFHWVFPLSGGRAVAFSGGSSGKPVEFFHSITNTWVTVNSTPIGVHAAVQFPDGKIWLATGDEVGTQVALYDPGSNSFRILNPRSAARRALTAVALQNWKVWMPGGTEILFTTTNLPLRTSELYDPNVVPDGQTLPGPMLAGDYAQGQMPGGYYPTTTLLPDGRVLFAGGSYSRGLNQVVRAAAGINIYDPGTNTATSFFPMKTPRYEHTATLLPTGQVLVVGGLIATTFTSIPTATTEILTLQ